MYIQLLLLDVKQGVAVQPAAARLRDVRDRDWKSWLWPM
jgi:hypothetical protein